MKKNASFDENYIRDLKSQIDARDGISDVLLKGTWKSDKLKNRLQQEVADKEGALQEDRLRGFQEIEPVKRNQ